MSGTLKLETNAQELMQRFDRLPGAVQDGILKGIKGALVVAESNFLKNPGVRMTGSRSGLSSRLTSYAQKDSIDQVDAAIGFRKTSHFPYELSQEFGAKAKAGGAMVIPLTPIAKALAQRGIGPREGFAAGRLRVIKTHSGAFLAEMVRGRRVIFGAALLWHYKLVKSIPARMRFRAAMMEAVPVISERIATGAREGLAKV